jgi:hypothetical protein
LERGWKITWFSSMIPRIMVSRSASFKPLSFDSLSLSSCKLSSLVIVGSDSSPCGERKALDDIAFAAHQLRRAAPLFCRQPSASKPPPAHASIASTTDRHNQSLWQVTPRIDALPPLRHNEATRATEHRSEQGSSSTQVGAWGC